MEALLKDDKTKVGALVAAGLTVAALMYHQRAVRNQVANIFMVRR